MKAIFLTVLLLPIFVFAQDAQTYEDCILENMRGISSDVAATAIREACESKFTVLEVADIESTASEVPQKENEVLDEPSNQEFVVQEKYTQSQERGDSESPPSNQNQGNNDLMRPRSEEPPNVAAKYICDLNELEDELRKEPRGNFINPARAPSIEKLGNLTPIFPWVNINLEITSGNNVSVCLSRNNVNLCLDTSDSNCQVTLYEQVACNIPQGALNYEVFGKYINEFRIDLIRTAQPALSFIYDISTNLLIMNIFDGVYDSGGLWKYDDYESSMLTVYSDTCMKKS